MPENERGRPRCQTVVSGPDQKISYSHHMAELAVKATAHSAQVRQDTVNSPTGGRS